MQKGNQFNRFASGSILLIVCLLIVSPARPNAEKDRKNAAKSLAREIQQAHFQKVYVSDFLDPQGGRNEQGCYFASVFSTYLVKTAEGFVVVNRIEAKKKLDELHISARDLQQPEVLAKAATALGADTVLIGSASISRKDARLSLSLRDVSSGKEVRAMDYHESLQPTFQDSFPAIEDASTHFYYFPGLDGVSQPKCVYCPNPDYTDDARRNGFQGSVMTSVRIDETGTISDIRVVWDPGFGLAQQSAEALKKWRVQPSRDPYGRPVSVRAPVEITFNMILRPNSD